MGSPAKHLSSWTHTHLKRLVGEQARVAVRNMQARCTRGLDVYAGFVRRFPAGTGAVTVGSLSVMGDATAQRIEMAHDEDKEYDYLRTLALATFGFCWNGPVNSKLYPMYERVFGRGTRASVIKAVAFDQAVYMPLMAVPMAFLVSDTVKNLRLDPRFTADHLRREWVASVYGTWVVWVPVEAINLGLVPLQFRVLFSAVGSFAWMVIMSTITSRQGISGKAQNKPPNTPAHPRCNVDPIMLGPDFDFRLTYRGADVLL